MTVLTAIMAGPIETLAAFATFWLAVGLPVALAAIATLATISFSTFLTATCWAFAFPFALTFAFAKQTFQSQWPANRLSS